MMSYKYYDFVWKDKYDLFIIFCVYFLILYVIKLNNKLIFDIGTVICPRAVLARRRQNVKIIFHFNMLC